MRVRVRACVRVRVPVCVCVCVCVPGPADGKLHTIKEFPPNGQARPLQPPVRHNRPPVTNNRPSQSIDRHNGCDEPPLPSVASGRPLPSTVRCNGRSVDCPLQRAVSIRGESEGGVGGWVGMEERVRGVCELHGKGSKSVCVWAPWRGRKKSVCGESAVARVRL